MMTPKADVFERIEQSVNLFRKNVLQISGPLLVGSIGFFILGELYRVLFISRIELSEALVNNPSSIFLQTEFVMAVVIGLIGILLYGILVIPITLASIKGASDAYRGNNISIPENLNYGFRSLIKSFGTYWYIFQYVFLIPLCILIIVLSLILFSLINGNEDIFVLGVTGISLSLLLLIFFMIYRGTKAKFALYAAIDNDAFTKENFKKSVGYTNNNWWRIVGNFLLIGFAIGFISGLLQILIGVFTGLVTQPSPLSEVDVSQAIGGLTHELTESLKTDLMNSFQEAGESFGQFNLVATIRGLLSSAIGSIFAAFLVTFTFIFYKRLQLETEGLEEEVTIENITERKEIIEVIEKTDEL